MNSLKSISGLTAATLVVAIISILYQFILSGILLPSEFAIFSLGLSVVLISGYPAIGMSNEFTRRVKLGEEYRSGRLNKSGFLGIILLISFFSAALSFFLFSSWLTSAIVSSVVCIGLFSNTTNGWWIGKMKFAEFGIFSVFSSLLRLFIGVGIILIYPHGEYAIISYGIGFMALPMIALLWNRDEFLNDVSMIFQDFERLLSSAFAYIVLGFLMNQDILISSILLPQILFEKYVYISLLTKSVLIVHGPIVAVMIPRLVESWNLDGGLEQISIQGTFRRYYVILAILTGAVCLFGGVMLQEINTNWEKQISQFNFQLMVVYFMMVGLTLIDINILISKGLVTKEIIPKIIWLLIPIFSFILLGERNDISEFVRFLLFLSFTQLIASRFLFRTDLSRRG